MGASASQVIYAMAAGIADDVEALRRDGITIDVPAAVAAFAANIEPEPAKRARLVTETLAALRAVGLKEV